jgi:hypothetical protein
MLGVPRKGDDVAPGSARQIGWLMVAERDRLGSHGSGRRHREE